MTSRERGLILITILIFFVHLSHLLNRCNTVYICCKKVDIDCVEYCDPFEECPDDLFMDNTTSMSDVLTGEEKDNGSGTGLLNAKSCRRGFRIVNGVCKRVF